MRDEGKTLIVVHHDLASAREYFDHLLLLNMRKVAFGQSVKSILINSYKKPMGED